MISPDIERYFGKSTRWTKLIRSAPFDWDPSTKEILWLNGWFRQWLWKLVTGLFFTFYAYCVGRVVHVKYFVNSTMKQVLVMCYATIIFSVGVVYQAHLLYYREQVVKFFNEALEFFRKFGESPNMRPRSEKLRIPLNETYGCIVTARIFHYGFRVCMVLYFVTVVRKPGLPHAIASLFPKPEELPLAGKLLLGALNAFMTCVTTSVFIVYQHALSTYVCCSLKILREIRIRWKENPRWSDSLLDVLEYAAWYRALQIRQRSFNRLFGRVILPILELIFISACVFGFYGAIRLPGARKALWFILSCLLLAQLSNMYRKMGLILEVSQGILGISRQFHGGGGGTRLRDLWLRKSFRAFRPICFTHGSFFFIDKPFILTVWTIIIINTNNLLLSIH